MHLVKQLFATKMAIGQSFNDAIKLQQDAKRRQKGKGHQGDRQAQLERTKRHQELMQSQKNWIAKAKAKAHAMWQSNKEKDAEKNLLQVEAVANRVKL